MMMFNDILETSKDLAEAKRRLARMANVESVIIAEKMPDRAPDNEPE
jgi:hypothetical protein